MTLEVDRGSTEDAVDEDDGLLCPARLLGNNERVGDSIIMGLSVPVCHWAGAKTEVWHRHPAPSKTELQYWFSISRLLLPAMAGRHGALGLISNRENTGGQVARVTKRMAGRNWRISDLFLQTVTRAGVKGQAGPNGRVKTVVVRLEEKQETKQRPGKGARLSGR